MLQTAGAAEGSVFLTEHSIQTRLQELHPVHKGLALLQGRHSQEFGLLDTDTESSNVLHLPDIKDIILRFIMTFYSQQVKDYIDYIF